MDAESIYFDPDKHPKDTLKAFKNFCIRFELRYEAQFSEPPKTAMDSCIQRWVLEHTTETVEKPVPTVQQYDELKENWKSRDKVTKLLGMFSSQRLYSDWEAAQPDETARRNASWTRFKTLIENSEADTGLLVLHTYTRLSSL